MYRLDLILRSAGVTVISDLYFLGIYPTRQISGNKITVACVTVWTQRNCKTMNCITMTSSVTGSL